MDGRSSSGSYDGLTQSNGFFLVVRVTRPINCRKDRQKLHGVVAMWRIEGCVVCVVRGEGCVVRVWLGLEAHGECRLAFIH